MNPPSASEFVVDLAHDDIFRVAIVDRSNRYQTGKAAPGAEVVVVPFRSSSPVIGEGVFNAKTCGLADARSAPEGLNKRLKRGEFVFSECDTTIAINQEAAERVSEPVTHRAQIILFDLAGRECGIRTTLVVALYGRAREVAFNSEDILAELVVLADLTAENAAGPVGVVGNERNSPTSGCHSTATDLAADIERKRHGGDDWLDEVRRHDR